MSFRIYHRTGANSGISMGPLTALFLYSLYGLMIFAAIALAVAVALVAGAIALIVALSRLVIREFRT
jgi:hypothetical protein